MNCLLVNQVHRVLLYHWLPSTLLSGLMGCVPCFHRQDVIFICMKTFFFMVRPLQPCRKNRKCTKTKVLGRCLHFWFQLFPKTFLLVESETPALSGFAAMRILLLVFFLTSFTETLGACQFIGFCRAGLLTSGNARYICSFPI